MSQKLQSFRKYLTKSKQIKQNWQRIENFSLSFDYYIQNLIREDQSGSQPLSSRNTEIFLFSLSRNQYFRQLKLLCNASTKVTIIHIQSRFTCGESNLHENTVNCRSCMARMVVSKLTKPSGSQSNHFLLTKGFSKRWKLWWLKRKKSN